MPVKRFLVPFLEINISIDLISVLFSSSSVNGFASPEKPRRPLPSMLPETTKLEGNGIKFECQKWKENFQIFVDLKRTLGKFTLNIFATSGGTPRPQKYCSSYMNDTLRRLLQRLYLCKRN